MHKNKIFRAAQTQAAYSISTPWPLPAVNLMYTSLCSITMGAVEGKKEKKKELIKEQKDKDVDVCACTCERDIFFFALVSEVPMCIGNCICISVGWELHGKRVCLLSLCCWFVLYSLH